MSVFTADGATYDAEGRWLRHTSILDVSGGTVEIRLIDGVPRFQIKENGVFKDAQLLPMVGENLVYNNDLGLVLTNDLCPIYLSEFQ